MTISTHQGYFLIADITGYTRYLSESELEHAQQTLTALLNLLIQKTKPPLIISRLAGDAVISYGLEDNFLSGQTFVELIEDTYVAFRRAIDQMVLNTSCNCNACANIHTLDLKFFIHYGSFGIQKLDAHDELVGSDVNTIHRMLKNSVAEKTGVRAYALYSDAAIKQLDLEAICTTMTYHEEVYEHLGTVPLWVYDMESVWQAKKDEAGLPFTPEEILIQLETYVDLPVERVWDYLTRTEFRSILIGSDRQEIDKRKDGRVDTGSVYVCYHGQAIRLQIVVLWKPFEHIVVEAPMPPPNTSTYWSFRLEPSGTGTRLVKVATKPMGDPAPMRWLLGKMLSMRKKEFAAKLQAFKLAIEQSPAQQDALPESASLSEQQIAQAAKEGLATAAGPPPEEGNA